MLLLYLGCPEEQLHLSLGLATLCRFVRISASNIHAACLYCGACFPCLPPKHAATVYAFVVAVYAFIYSSTVTEAPHTRPASPLDGFGRFRWVQ